MRNKKVATCCIFLFVMVFLFTSAIAEARWGRCRHELLSIPLPRADDFTCQEPNQPRGNVFIIYNTNGPDLFTLNAINLEPNERHTVFLSDCNLNNLQFIGEFTTKANGTGKLKLKAEITDAYYAEAGQPGENQNLVRLDYVTIYKNDAPSGVNWCQTFPNANFAFDTNLGPNDCTGIRDWGPPVAGTQCPFCYGCTPCTYLCDRDIECCGVPGCLNPDLPCPEPQR